MKKKILITAFLILLIFSLFLFRTYKFTSLQVVESHFGKDNITKVFSEIKRDWGTAYLVETTEGIRSIFVEKRAFLWNAFAITEFSDNFIKNDLVKTVGWISVGNNKNNQLTILAVQNIDPNVSYIEAGSNLDKQRKAIGLNEIAIFTWDKIIGGHELNAIALDKDNSTIYKYGNNPNDLSINQRYDLRWYQE